MVNSTSEIREKYLDLQALSPNHELLRYFVVNGLEIKLNLDGGLVEDFSQRFGIEVTLEAYEGTNFKEYQRALVEGCFTKYFDKLNTTIDEILSQE